jgi:hypothetical protein
LQEVANANAAEHQDAFELPAWLLLALNLETREKWREVQYSVLKRRGCSTFVL